MSLTLEQLEPFLRQRPPRDIPRDVFRRGLRGGLGRFGYLFGGFFAAFGSVFVFIFFPWSIYPEVLLDTDHGIELPGIVSEVQETNMTVNDRKVRRVEYEFESPNGELIAAACYVTGRAAEAGAEVVVEALPERFDQSRIQGGRINAFGYFGSFTIIFPLVGLSVLTATGVYRRRRKRILKHGEFASGTVRDVQATAWTSNNQQRYRVKIDYVIAGRPQTVQHHCYGDAVTLAREHQRSGEPIGLLADPSNPRRVILVETLTGATDHPTSRIRKVLGTAFRGIKESRTLNTSII